MKRVLQLALIVLVMGPYCAVAAPIVFSSSGSAAGFALDATMSASPSFSVAQARITTSWTIGDEQTVGDSMVSATVTSTVTDSSASATGIFQLTRGSNLFGAIGGDYELTFTLLEPTTYQLSLFGTALKDHSQSRPSNISATFIGNDVFYHNAFSGVGMLNAPANGVLLPGDYRVAISFEGASTFIPHSGSSGSVFGSMNFSLELAPVAVPEPTSMLLLGAGLAAVAGRRFSARERR